jgi:hypothetical protein
MQVVDGAIPMPGRFEVDANKTERGLLLLPPANHVSHADL